MKRDGGRRTIGTAKGQRRRGAAIAVSFAIHAVVLALLAWSTPALRLPTAAFAPDVTVQLVRLLPPDARRTPSPAVAPRPAAATPSPAPAQTVRRIPTPPPPTPLPAPARPPRPAPASATPAPAPGPPSARPGPPGPQASAPASPADSGGDVRGAVRAAIGCSHEEFLKLTPAERAACDRKMAETPPRGAYVDPIPPLKRGAYDRQAAADARRRDHTGPMQELIVPCQGPGSNFGTGCLPAEAMHGLRVGPTPRAPAPDPNP